MARNVIACGTESPARNSERHPHDITPEVGIAGHQGIRLPDERHRGYGHGGQQIKGADGSTAAAS
jgi:hypothetical protein